MVNGRTIQEELKRIDTFFQNLSIEELENIAFECGLGEIEPSYRSRYVVACSYNFKHNKTKDSKFLSDSKFSVKDNKEVLGAA